MRPIALRKLIAFAAVTFFTVSAYGSAAYAIPAFARQNELACSTCHTAWPLLNETGRKFKENGYKFSEDQVPGNVISDFLNLDADFPIAAVIKSRPYDKKESGDAKIRAVHEFEIMVAGTVYKNISAFIELEGEDEDNFEPKIGGWVTWHASPFANVQVSYDSAFVADPYDTLANVRRLTRGRSAVIDQRFGGADNNGRLRDSRQSISLYGRPHERVFYLIGYSGPAGDPEGENPGNVQARLAVDAVPGKLTVGAFGMWGECEAGAANCAINRDFSRIGFDVQGNYRHFVLHGAYVTAKDDANALNPLDGSQPEAKNSAWYVEGIYAYQKDGRPFLVPMVRFDKYEKNDGTEDFTELTMNVGYYMAQNVRIYGEWWKQLDTPVGVEKDGRFTIQLELGF